MSILFGTDFSDAAQEAAVAAAALAKRLGFPLEVVHAWPGGRPEERARLDRRLEDERQRLAGWGVPVRASLLEGLPDEALLERAEKTNAALVVTAAVGARAGRYALGHIPDRMAQTSQRPYLVLRGAQSFVAWAKGERPLRVAVGDDRSPVSRGALAWVRDLAKAGPVEITVVHAYWPPAEYERLGAYSSDEGPSAVERVLERELRQRLETMGLGSARTRITMSYGRVVDPLVSAAREVQADVLVLGGHFRTRLSRLRHGSVARAALQMAPTAVAMVPASARAAAEEEARVPTIERVLVTTDFSSLANAAIPYAYGIARQGGTVTVAHVIELSMAVLYADFWPAPPVMATPTPEMISTLKRELERLVPREAAARGIRTELEVFPSVDVATGICQAAERTGADIICMSTHGRSGLTRLLAGSVAQAVLARCRKPLLLVHPRPDA